MKLKEITLHKEFKKGLPNFSNITVGTYMTFEIGENEQPDWDAAWDTINSQLSNQAESNDPAWITTKETSKHFVTTIKTPKQAISNCKCGTTGAYHALDCPARTK